MFYFRRMAGRIRQYCASCEFCQRNKSYNADTRGVPQPLPIPSCRFSVVSLDLISEFSLSKNGNNIVVVFTDRLSKRVWLEAINKASSARDLAEIFLHIVFRSQGMPSILLSDQGLQFQSQFWKEFFGLLRSNVRLTSSYHPQSNGGTEKFNKTLLKSLRHLVNVRQDKWEEQLPYMTSRTMPHLMLPLVCHSLNSSLVKIRVCLSMLFFQGRWILSKKRGHVDSTMRKNLVDL